MDPLDADSLARPLGVGLLGFLAVGITGAQQGGYFPPSWGWSALGLLLAVAAALVFRTSLEAARLRAAFVGGLALVVLWTAFSIVWSTSVPRTVAELERSIVYLAALAALFALASRRDLPYLLAGVLAAITAVSAYALVLHVSDPSDAQPVAGSLGYWNALGILASIGILLSLGFASHGPRLAIRLGAIAAVPLLATTLYLTQSRGAGGALAVGLLCYVGLHPRLRRAAGVAALLALIGGGAILSAWAGGPGELVSRTYAAFSAPVGGEGEPPKTAFSLSGKDRADYWRVAWEAYRAHPWVGSGAGTFAIHWYRDRRSIFGAQDAHNLYLETLSELGGVGLLLLVATLATPLLSLPGGRGDALDRAAAAAYIAFLIHAGVDWDWEMPAVTLAGLFCGGGLALGIAGRRLAISNAGRGIGLALVTATAAFVLVGYVGNSALQASANTAMRGDFERSEAEARSAALWNPWSSESWRLRGEAERARGDRRAAQVSFREGIAIDRNDWRLWYDLALVTDGADQQQALAEAERLNPLGADVRALRGR